MSSSVQRLEETGCALRDALLRQDWVAIGKLDLQCRQAVDAAMHEGGDEARLRDSMQELLLLYRELVTLCTAERKRLGDELVQINQARQGAKVYQLFG
ncbi:MULTISPECIES: flagellar protein FliT [Pseudomonadaceae]|uniref:Flagellar protein FliT n=3 Tax=Pseudomonadaceae TaxID=135621 RepID=A0A1H2LPD3_9PSED|nr:MULTISPECIES: flagellar protein FliT [Pseudomonas]MDG9757396.1 flagellar protein FliT [Pseudomonas sediminis]MDH1340810.1 flagellar protein FliT [Pseudomonas oleovorans]MDH1493468.1 flagellar protein FliT [Pseudomonas oleovorans]MDH1621984.1 flagellar protein FliT [Pseudomonas chengduensis]MDH1868700.1 flagellar protein FliT [Pseudomonas chengduensis]